MQTTKGSMDVQKLIEARLHALDVGRSARANAHFIQLSLAIELIVQELLELNDQLAGDDK